MDYYYYYFILILFLRRNKPNKEYTKKTKRDN